MTVVDLHPEDLLDKEARGTLSSSEEACLRAHLARCATCRFEREARADFGSDLDDDASLSAGRIALLVHAGMNAEPSAPASPPDEESAGVERSDGASARRDRVVDVGAQSPDVLGVRRRIRPYLRRAGLVAAVAAALMVGGIAGASELGAHAWARWLGLSVAASPRESAPQVEASSAPKPTGRRRPPMPAPMLVGDDARTDGDVDRASVTATSLDEAMVEEPPVPAPHALPAHRPAVREATEHDAPAPRTVAAPRATAATLFDGASEARRRGDYGRALELDAELQKQFPASREAHVSRAATGRLRLDRGDVTGALADFDAYRARGTGELDEAVMVGRATALDRLGRTSEAARAWQALLVAFPDTAYAAHARKRADAGKGEPTW